jgi:hypothetical protein
VAALAVADAHRGRWRAARPGPPGAKNQLRQTAETVDFLFERVHSVWNYRSWRSLMIGRRSAHSERSPLYARQANLLHRPALRSGRSYCPEGRLDMPTASECRQHAKECLQLASTAVDFYVQAALTELAGDFQEMAAIRELTKPGDPR